MEKETVVEIQIQELAGVSESSELMALLGIATDFQPVEELRRVVSRYGNDPDWTLFVAQLRGKMVGLLGLREREGSRFDICHFAVDEKHQNRGFGRALIHEGFATFPMIELRAKATSEAAGFFHRNGFEMVDVTVDNRGVQSFSFSLKRQ